MNDTLSAAEPLDNRRVTRRAIDCDVHPAVPSVEVLTPYLPAYWQEQIRLSGFKGPIGLQLYSLRDQFAKDVPGSVLACTVRLPSLNSGRNAVPAPARAATAAPRSMSDTRNTGLG